MNFSEGQILLWIGKQIFKGLIVLGTLFLSAVYLCISLAFLKDPCRNETFLSSHSIDKTYRVVTWLAHLFCSKNTQVLSHTICLCRVGPNSSALFPSRASLSDSCHGCRDPQGFEDQERSLVCATWPFYSFVPAKFLSGNHDTP
jgi:hypothetical protein